MLLSLPVASLRRRSGVLGLMFLVFVPCSIVVLVSGPDLSQEQVLLQRLAELQTKLQRLDSMHQARQEEVHILSQHLGTLLAADGNGSSVYQPLSPEMRALLRNLTGLQRGNSTQLLRPPSVYHFLPHLLESPSSLRPAYCLSRGRTGGTLCSYSYVENGHRQEFRLVGCDSVV
jgi:alpha-1,3-mannosylglycoprotein beta-1,4-N-acetylglucosaminyltransferase A/B